MKRDEPSSPKDIPRTKLVSGADGRLRQSRDESDSIDELWASGVEIRRQEAQEEARRKLRRQKLRQDKGLVGAAKTDVTKLLGKAKKELFGEQSISKPKPKSVRKQVNAPAQKTVEIKLSLPTLPRPSLKPLKRLFGRVPRVVYVVISVVIALALIGFVGYKWFDGRNNGADRSSNSHNSGEEVVGSVTPGYKTVLPDGKTIDQLGGWALVSPPKADPVYAFSDEIGGVKISVSQQPLPPKLQTDDDIANLADSYDAKQVLKAGSTKIYLGTSARGPQSLILVKDKLLILIKSTTIVPSNQWVDYVESLN